MGKGYLSAHMILGARGLGEVEDGRGGGGRAESRPPRVQGTKTRYLELGGGGGSQKGKPEEQLGIWASEMRGFGEPGERQG